MTIRPYWLCSHTVIIRPYWLCSHTVTIRPYWLCSHTSSYQAFSFFKWLGNKYQPTASYLKVGTGFSTCVRIWSRSDRQWQVHTCADSVELKKSLLTLPQPGVKPTAVGYTGLPALATVNPVMVYLESFGAVESGAGYRAHHGMKLQQSGQQRHVLELNRQSKTWSNISPFQFMACNNNYYHNKGLKNGEKKKVQDQKTTYNK